MIKNFGIIYKLLSFLADFWDIWLERLEGEFVYYG